MDLVKFKEELRKEAVIRHLDKGGDTPMLDRLQIHLDQLEGYSIEKMLSPKNLKSDLYLSMLYQIIYPAKTKKTLYLEYQNIPILGKNNTECLIKLINLINPKLISQTSYKEFLVDEIPKFLSKNILPSSYKRLKNGQFFDRSFGGKGINNHIKFFIRDINKELGLNIKQDFICKTEYK